MSQTLTFHFPDGSSTIHYLHTDHTSTTLSTGLGSWTAVTDETGTVVDEQCYDAWGNRRDPATWTSYNYSPPEPKYDRGFTGHVQQPFGLLDEANQLRMPIPLRNESGKHLDGFQLINPDTLHFIALSGSATANFSLHSVCENQASAGMNGRMYDPVVSRMLAPDNFVQTPDFSQNFNRYSYALNNPLMFVDPDGEILGFLIAGAIIGAYIGGSIAEDDFNPGNWAWDKNTWSGIAVGGLIGTATGGVIGAMWSAGATVTIGANLFGNSVPLISFSQAGFSTANTVAGLIGVGGLGVGGVASLDYSSLNVSKALQNMHSREKMFNQAVSDWQSSINQAINSIYIDTEFRIDYGNQIALEARIMGIDAGFSIADDSKPIAQINAGYENGWYANSYSRGGKDDTYGYNGVKYPIREYWSAGIGAFSGQSSYSPTRVPFNFGYLTHESINISFYNVQKRYDPSGNIVGTQHGLRTGFDIAVLLGIHLNFEIGYKK